MAVTSVTISPYLSVGKVGQEFQLIATVVVTGGESTDVTWASDKTEVTVVAGLVTVVSTFTGAATITATSVADITKKGTTKLILYNPFVLNNIGVAITIPGDIRNRKISFAFSLQNIGVAVNAGTIPRVHMMQFSMQNIGVAVKDGGYSTLWYEIK